MGSIEEEKDFVEKKQYNVFRDSPIRWCGYANEIGESFRYQLPRLVKPSYALAFGYVGMDAISTGYREWNEPNHDERSRETRTTIATFDTMLWQTLASVMIPGVTINLIVKASRVTMKKFTFFPVLMSKWFPTVIGLGSIPIIIHPIDNFVDFALDNSTRRLGK